MDTNIAIKVKDLSKYFYVSERTKNLNLFTTNQNNSNWKSSKKNVIRAVDTISFEVRKGEIFGLLGPNGAGKTTTVRLLTGVLEPTSGNINILGKDFLKNKLSIQQIIGNVPEMANAYLDLTGFQNLELISELYGINKKKRNQRSKYLLRKFDLFEKRNLKAKKYSKGMKQRLLLCMALVSEPKILFLDEPTSGLDVQSSIMIKSLIKEYNKSGMTVVLTTHNMDVANELCDRIGIINRGRIVGLDTPHNLRKLKQQYQALDIYFEEKDIFSKEIKNRPSIKDISKIGGYHRIIVSDLNNGLCDIIEHAKSYNLKISKINTYEPHLQDIFLEIINEGGV